MVTVNDRARARVHERVVYTLLLNHNSTFKWIQIENRLKTEQPNFSRLCHAMQFYLKSNAMEMCRKKRKQKRKAELVSCGTACLCCAQMMIMNTEDQLAQIFIEFFGASFIFLHSSSSSVDIAVVVYDDFFSVSTIAAVADVTSC